MQEQTLTPADPTLPPNVCMIGTSSFAGLVAGPFWLEVVQELREIMDSDFERFRFLFHVLKTGNVPDVSEFASSDTVVISLADNSGDHFEEEYEGFKAVFKVHLSGASGNVHPIPLGYTRMHLHGSEAPLSERNTDVFYSGNLNANRVDFFRSLYTGGLPPSGNVNSRLIRRGMLHAIRKLRLRRNFDTTFPNSYIRFTEAFASGLEPAEYTAKLADSKIAISPRGFWRPECFRDHEAMRSGCVIISDPLFPTWYFKDSPIIQLSEWSKLKSVVKRLLASPDELQSLQIATLDWWREKCSPKAVAKYIASQLIQ
jgi:hypothetical protein